MLCFARKESIKIYGKQYLSILKTKTISTQETLLEEMARIKYIEQYTNQKFVPAMYYCFLYYFIYKTSALRNTVETSSLSHTIRKTLLSSNNITQLTTRQIKKRISDEDIKLLLYRRKTEYLEPLNYKCEKALF